MFWFMPDFKEALGFEKSASFCAFYGFSLTCSRSRKYLQYQIQIVYTCIYPFVMPVLFIKTTIIWLVFVAEI